MAGTAVPVDRPSLDRTVELMQHACAQSNNLILVSKRQDGNPVLRHIRNVRWQFAEIVPDYILGNGTAALFLSLRYHLLHPEYLHFRIRELQKFFRLRVILCQVDVEDPETPLCEINRLAALSQFALLCAWSAPEAARHLEGLKVFESKSADAIQGRTDKDYVSRLVGCITAVRGLNKLDVHTLGSHFGSLADILSAAPEQLAACPGIGPTKVRRMADAFGGPLKRVGAAAAGAAAGAGAAGTAAGGGAEGGAAAGQGGREDSAGAAGDGGGPGGGEAKRRRTGGGGAEGEGGADRDTADGEASPDPEGDFVDYGGAEAREGGAGDGGGAGPSGAERGRGGAAGPSEGASSSGQRAAAAGGGEQPSAGSGGGGGAMRPPPAGGGLPSALQAGGGSGRWGRTTDVFVEAEDDEGLDEID